MTRTANDMPRTAYYYGRVSDPSQLKGTGKKRQREGVQQLARRKGWVLADTQFNDDGISAFSGANLTHGDLGRFFAMVKAGQIKPGSILVVESLDRLIRPSDMAPALRLWSAFLEAKISVATVIGDRFYDAFAPDFASTLMALAEMDRGGNESRTKSHRLKDWWQRARERKVHTSPPAWLEQHDGNDWPERPDRVKIVRQIFALARDGVSVDRITQQLNTTRVPPMGHHGKGGKAKQWTSGYVYRILTSKAVIGEFTPHVGSLRTEEKRAARKALAPIKGYYPAIVTEDEFFTVQALLQKRRAHTGPRKKANTTNLLTGLVFDAWDGSPMSVAQKRADHPDKQLVAYNAAIGTPGSRYLGIRYSEVESVILKSLTELRPCDLTEAPEGDELTVMEARIEDIGEQLAEYKARLLKKASATILDTVEQLETEREELRGKIDAQRARSVGSAADHLEETQGVIELLARAKGEELAKLRDRLKSKLSLLVESVWVYVFTHGDRPRTRWAQKWAYLQIHLHGGKAYDCFIKQGDWRLWYAGRMDGLEFDLRTFKELKGEKQFDKLREMMEAALLLKHEDIRETEAVTA